MQASAERREPHRDCEAHIPTAWDGGKAARPPAP
jgi:hypothetical protein